MLVAERQQYMEPYYPHVEEEREQPVAEPSSEPRVEPTIETKVRPGTKPQRKVLHFCSVLIGFAICAYVVARFAMIAENQQEILNLETALQKQQSIQESLEVELAARGDLQRIEDYARNNLEMDYPDQGQIFAIELPEQSTEDIPGSTIASEDEESLWSKIFDLLIN